MKKKLLILVSCLVIGAIVCAESVNNYNLNVSITSLAATSTNATAGTVMELSQPLGTSRIYFTASGDSSCTAGTLIADIVTATGRTGVTNEFDSVIVNPISLTLSNSLATVTNTVSQSINLSGVRYIRVARIRNTYGGVTSNFNVRVSYSTGINQP